METKIPALIHQSWMDQWPKSVFTTFPYFTFLCNISELPAEQFIIYRPKGSKISGAPDTPPEIIERMKSAILQFETAEVSLKPLYCKGNGTCSSWAVWVAKTVTENSQEQPCHFVYFDARNRHRLCLESVNGILVDSSAGKPVQLVDGQDVKLDGEAEIVYTIKDMGKESVQLTYTKKNKKSELELFKTKQFEQWQDALMRCLVQNITNPSVLAFFRTMDGQQCAFDGLIRWEKGSNIITWTSEDAEEVDTEEADVTTKWTVSTYKAIFENASEELAKDCTMKLRAWLQKKSFRWEQFQMIQTDFSMVWNALVLRFGLPRAEMEIEIR